MQYKMNKKKVENYIFIYISLVGYSSGRLIGLGKHINSLVLGWKIIKIYLEYALI